MLQLDIKIFYFINRGLTNPVFDNTLPYITDLHKSAIAVALAAMGALAYLYFRRREAVHVLLVGILAVAATDIVTSYGIKPFFKRARPTAAIHDVALRTPVHYGLSFPSNHAANSFALATVIARGAPAAAVPAYAVAFLISFSRVYLGVHFPSDVLAGALLGSLIGWAFWRMLGGRLRLRRRA